MAEELNPLTIGDIPEELIENADGSIDIEGLEDPNVEPSDFLVNLAEVIPESTLLSLAMEFTELVEKDRKSREKRDEQYAEGIKRTGLSDDAPGGADFDGANKVVHPVLVEACVDFASRAIKELFPASGPAKAWIPGEVTPEKTERANRKARFLNWQTTTQIKEYRDELEQILAQIPMGGSQYQKFWYDPRVRRPRSEFVPVDDMILPYAASSFYSAQRATHRQPITRSELEQRIKSGLYRDLLPVSDVNSLDTTAAQQANDKVEGREEDGYNQDGVRYILEIYTWLNLEDDDITAGEYAPYILTIDEDTEKVLAIYRNWDEDDYLYEKLDWFVEWKFIPWRGAYALGLPHIIGGLSAALTGSLRALLDSAHINNAATMLKLKGASRTNGQTTQVDVTQVCEIEGPAGVDDIRKLAMPMPFNPPSPVLITLLDKLYGLAKGVIATAEDQLGNVGDRTPVGTTMALIEQGSNTYSAIHARLHHSQKKALEILQRINSKFLDEEAIERFGDSRLTREDFSETEDVIPVSDPTIFSEAQRFAQSQSIYQMASADLQNPMVKWNQVAVRRRMLKQMRVEDADTLLPPEKEPVSADVLTENTLFMQMHPLKAQSDQEHMAHINGHMAFLMSPLQLQNPLVPPQLLQGLMQHIGEHIQMLQTKQVMATAQTLGYDDAAIAQAYAQIGPIFAQSMAPVLQALQQAQQALQQRTPPPPMPPEVQATLQIAQMENQRKTQLDQATIANDKAKLDAGNQLDQMRLQQDAAEMQFQQQLQSAREQFDQMLKVMQQRSEDQHNQVSHQIQLMMNEQDNHQKQMTELLKNRDDNETKLLIEQIKVQLESLQTDVTVSRNTPQASQPDMGPQLKQLQAALDQIGRQQTNDALGEIMNGLRETINSLNKPKMLVKDNQGNTIGVRSAE